MWFGVVYWPRGCTLTNSGMWFDITNTIVETFVKRLSCVARITHHIHSVMFKSNILEQLLKLQEEQSYSSLDLNISLLLLDLYRILDFNV